MRTPPWGSRSEACAPGVRAVTYTCSTLPTASTLEGAATAPWGARELMSRPALRARAPARMRLAAVRLPTFVPSSMSPRLSTLDLTDHIPPVAGETRANLRRYAALVALFDDVSPSPSTGRPAFPNCDLLRATIPTSRGGLVCLPCEPTARRRGRASDTDF